jgi:flagellar M-ring protein FliF
VLDSRGKVLSRTGPSDITGKMSATMMETQRSYEKNLEERLQSLLDKAVGAGKSVARVNAVLNFQQVEKVEERYDPEAQVVRSEKRSEQKEGTTLAVSGVPGVQTNLGKTNAGQTTAAGGSKRDETVNYELSRSSAKIIEPVGNLTKLSVAILVDGKYEAAAPTKAGQPTKPKYVPLTPEELNKIEALVRGSVGYSEERGDQLTVVNVPFQDTGDDVANVIPQWWEKPAVVEMGKNGLLGIGFIALLLLVVRPLMKVLVTPQKKAKSTMETLQSIEENQDKLEGKHQPHLAQLGMAMVNQTDFNELVKKDPYQTAQILQNWLKQKD